MTMDYSIDLIPVSRGFDGRTFWAQARVGAIPGRGGQPPTVIVTAQPTLRSGSDVFFALSEWRTTDLGQTWDGPIEHADTLGRRQEPDGVTVAICDMTPGWHTATRTLLTTGHTVRYRDDREPITARRRETERELVPNRGARLGNFAVCTVSPNETWVVVAEWMQPVGCERYGSDNTIWAARIVWESAPPPMARGPGGVQG